MDRRSFVKGAVAGAAGAGIGGVVATERASAKVRTGAELEGQDFGGIGRGSAQVLWSVNTSERLVALTFDDGPHPRLTAQVLDVLADREAKATFFLLGQAAARHPDLVARIVDEGHEVGNHSNSHASVSHLSGDGARAEVLAGSAAIERLTGAAPRWYRPPRGMLNGAVMRAAADLGQDVAMWSARIRIAPPEAESADLVSQMMRDLHPGAV